ncbi:MAG TPA: PepSY domain-containing protein [Anaerolineales bacterium]|nr:PepSY domain-containing protein [Anaerolineales bacterium]
MSRGLQWVLGICAVAVTVVIVLGAMAMWFGGWTSWSPVVSMMGQYGSGMMGQYGSGMMGGYGSGTTGQYGSGMMGQYGSGMMGGYGWTSGGPGGAIAPNAQRISIERAVSIAEDYAAAFAAGLHTAEVMEFENNFYAVLVEDHSGRGALEILIDPYTGAVSPEPGPDMMWNDKYGMMGSGRSADNRLTLDQARDQAQAALDSQLPGSKVHDDAAEFYGYYTFDYDGPDGAIAGMLSVHGDSGAVWLHTWHGDFIAETEVAEATS